MVHYTHELQPEGMIAKARIRAARPHRPRGMQRREARLGRHTEPGAGRPRPHRSPRKVHRSRTLRCDNCRRARQFPCSISNGLIGAERPSHCTACAQACHETVGELAAYRLMRRGTA